MDAAQRRELMFDAYAYFKAAHLFVRHARNAKADTDVRREQMYLRMVRDMHDAARTQLRTLNEGQTHVHTD